MAHENIDDDDDDGYLGAIGIMYDGETSKNWVRHELPCCPCPTSSTAAAAAAADVVVVEVKCIDDDGPGALQSGQYVWPGAPFLARFVARHWGRHPLLQLPTSEQSRVLELGAGCGLVGLTVAQMAGCAAVTMTDHDPGTLRLIEEGAARNAPRLRAHCRAVLLEWGSEPQGLDEAYDLVIGSDLIYSDTVVRPLLQTVALVLRRARARPEGASSGSSSSGGDDARFLLCGSFALGEAIEAEVARVCAELKLVRAPVDLRGAAPGEDVPETVWMECLTLQTPP